MTEDQVVQLYRAFGRLVQTRRKEIPDMTQDKLGQLVGLSRTSITNLEKGRQHVSLHQVFAIADALGTGPESLLPLVENAPLDSWVDSKLPPHTELDLRQWVTGVTRSVSSRKR